MSLTTVAYLNDLPDARRSTDPICETRRALSPISQESNDIHSHIADGNHSLTGHTPPENQISNAGQHNRVQPPISLSQPQASTAGWTELRTWAAMLDDQMEHRKALRNKTCADWAEPRPGIIPDLYASILSQVEHVEHQMALSMRRSYRRVVPPEIIAWQKNRKGIGEHLMARLLGHLGDPCIATPHWYEGTGTNRVLMEGEPYLRTVGQLWQFCGHGDPNRRHKVKGISAEQLAAAGSPTLKMLTHLLAEACMKQSSGNTYRDVYEKARENASGKLHVTECVRCGPSGKPSPIGSPWSKAHQHAHGLRIVGKELLRDMWIVRHDALGLGQSAAETQPSNDKCEVQP